MFKNWSLTSFSSEVNALKFGIWFLETLRVRRCEKSATSEISVRAFVLRSRCWISLNFNMEGKILYNYFSAKVSLTKVTVLLSEVLQSPLTEPFKASSSFFISYSLLTLASSYNLFRSYSCCLRSYSLSLYSYCSCSYVFSGGCSPSATSAI